MRTHVTFRYPAKLSEESDESGILAVCAALWFAELLRRLLGLQLEEELFQEDWGVVAFVRRDGQRFWIGLSTWEGENSWIAHFHHGTFALLQWFSSTGKRALQRLLVDAHDALKSDGNVTEITWYEEREVRRAQPKGFATPIGA